MEECLHISNLQEGDGDVWTGDTSSEADSSMALGDQATLGAGGHSAAEEQWRPLDESERLRVSAGLAAPA